MSANPRPVFFYDVCDPWCWLAGERLGGSVVWEPVVAGALGASGDIDRADVEAVARADGHPPIRWPDPFPVDSELAMLAATFAKRSGRVVAFSLAAMRQSFLAGRDLSLEDNVVIAAAACELHPRAVLSGIGLRSTREALDGAVAGASERGVTALPALVTGDSVVTGRDAVETSSRA